jgi:hypothetical protein
VNPKLYRAVANGNILADVPQGLIDAGIYVPVDDEPQATAPAPRPAAEMAPLVQPEAEILTTAHVPAAPTRGKTARARRRRG